MPGRAQRGQMMFEVALVVILISILMVVALDRLLPLRLEAERVGVLANLGVMQRALGNAVAERVLSEQGIAGVAELDGSNPINTLAQAPGNYLGERNVLDPVAIESGHWYFERSSGLLIYRVRYDDDFESELSGPARVRYRVRLVYRDSDGDGRFDPEHDRPQGLRLESVDRYRWNGVEVLPR